MHIVEEFHGCNHFTCIYQADPGISEHRGAVLVWWNFWDLGIFLRPRIPYAYVVRTMDEKIHMIVNICLLTWGRGGGGAGPGFALEYVLYTFMIRRPKSCESLIACVWDVGPRTESLKELHVRLI